MQRANAIDAALEAENRARAEPSMRSAAERRGAILLPHRPENVGLMILCGPKRERPCVVGMADDGRTYNIRDERGRVRLAIPLGAHARSTTRLARRGSKLFVLAPRVTPGKVTSRTACECDARLQIYSATGFIRLGFTFLVDEMPDVEVEEVLVPVTEDRIEWKCHGRLL